MTIVARASESLHWYRKDGAPQYTVTAKNGNERPTTLADAKKMDLLPSVTTIMNCAAKPGLEAWKLNQMLLAALTLPRADQEPEESYVQRIINDSREQARHAAQRGTDIHAVVESWYEGVMIADRLEYQMGVAEAVEKHFGRRNWETEKSFGSKHGFGGKIDLHTKDGDGIVIDFKTKEFSDPAKVEAYDENAMQLSAYREGLEMPYARCANVFISVTEPGLVVVKEWEPEELDRAWKMFDSLKNYYYAKSKL
jgi:hypothetical protein